MMRDAYVRLAGNKGVEISGSDDELLEMMAAIQDALEAHQKQHEEAAEE